MAIRRVFTLLRRLHANAGASRASPSAADRGALWRRLSLLRVDGMAAAAARGQRARACAVGRLQAIRADGEAASEAMVACAEARARAVRAFLRHARSRAGAAAALAGNRVRQASDRTIAAYLRVAYGDSAPRIEVLTISPVALRCAVPSLFYRSRNCL
jgi:hypothetical protein